MNNFNNLYKILILSFFGFLMLVSVSKAQNNICEGETGTFVLQGHTGSIQWQKSTDLVNWSDVTGATSNQLQITGTNPSLVEYYRAAVTNGTCLPFYSDTIFFNIESVVTPSINITSDVGIFVCSGDVATYTASINNGGINPTYIWKINNTTVGTNSPVFSSNNINAGDVVSCLLVSSEACKSIDTVASNTFLMFVNQSVVPTVSIVASQTSICEFENVTFTSTVSSAGGGNISYQWKINGNVVATSANFSSNSLANNDVVTCEVSTDALCANAGFVSSNSITMTVFEDVFPSAIITASKTIICPGETVTFSAITQNAGLNPGYTWKRNGNVVGINLTYTANNFSNGDEIILEILNNDPCISFPIGISNNISISVQSPVTPDVTIAAFPNNQICQGQSATIIANPTNFGNNPSYNWTVNGIPTGIDSIIFESNALNNGDQIRCIVTSGGDICLTNNSETSLPVTMNVSPVINPTVEVFTTGTTACSGDSISFFADVSNQMGASVSYSWKRNGNTVSTGTTYTSTLLNTNDSIWCEVLLIGVCTDGPVISNGFKVTIFPPPTPSATISYFCNNGFFEFSAITQNEGVNPSYEWQVNGNTVSNSAVFSSNTLNINDSVRLIIGNNDCGTASLEYSNTVVITNGC
jgi:hypothetical protein